MAPAVPGPPHRLYVRERRAASLAATGRVWLAFVLTWLGGFVDTVGALVLLRVLVANMSGNTINLGIGLAQRRWEETLPRAFVFPAFLLGLMASRLLLHVARRRALLRVASCLFGLEALLLLAFLLLGGGGVGEKEAVLPSARFYLLLALPALAMGLQNETLTHFGPLTVRTTHVTGNLVHFAEDCADILLALHDRTRGRKGTSLAKAFAEIRREPTYRQAILLGTVWLSYLVGAFTGALLALRWGLVALALPIAGLALLVGADLLSPLLRFEAVKPPGG
jgi:uncharacterized membrane protein YoaK (UPF0700 family)